MSHLEFPWMLHKPDGQTLVVHNEIERQAAIRDGWVKDIRELSAPDAEPEPEPAPKKGRKKA